MTEMLTGIDLVATQIRIAAGEPLGFTQSDVDSAGHAIEFRINAEDPERDFRPSAGIVERYLAPGGPGIRMDSHLYAGYEVPPFYDSLLGKLIVWGPTREAAIARARAALDELLVEGLVTNVSIHKALLRSEPFLEGRMTTNLLDRVGSAAFLRRPRERDVDPARRRYAGRRPSRRTGPGPCTPATTSPRERRAPGHTGTIHPEPPVTEAATAPTPQKLETIHSTREIEALIPHRWPILLVDRIVEYDPDAKRIVGIKGVDRDRVVLPGPLPGAAGDAGRPPGRGARPDDGGLRREAARVRRPDRAVRGHRRRRFKRIVVPGDVLRLEITMEKLGSRFGRAAAWPPSTARSPAKDAELHHSRPRACCDDGSCRRPVGRPRQRHCARRGAQGDSQGASRTRVFVAGDLVMNGPEPAAARRRRPRARGRRARSSSRAIPTSPSPTSTTRQPSLDDRRRPGHVPRGRRVGPRRAGRRRLDWLRRLPVRAAVCGSSDDDVPRLPRVAGLQTQGFDQALDPSVILERVVAAPTPASSAAATPTCRRSATSAGR